MQSLDARPDSLYNVCVAIENVSTPWVPVNEKENQGKQSYYEFYINWWEEIDHV